MFSFGMRINIFIVEGNKFEPSKNMARKAFKNGVLLSSTPVQSFEDSGYFGSDKKNSCKTKICHAFSPLQEYSFKTVLLEQLPSELDSEASEANRTDNEENLHPSESKDSLLENLYELTVPVIKSSTTPAKVCPNLSTLLFNDTSGISLSCSPDLLSQDNDIKYELFPGIETASSSPCLKTASKNVGRTKVDFLQNLKQINCESIISVILSCLTAEELCKASCVSKNWNKAVSEDKRGSSRRAEFLHQRKVNLTGSMKENRLGMRFGPSREHKKAFSGITNTYLEGGQVLKTTAEKSKFDSFIKEAKEQTKLQKCPKCAYASVMTNSKTSECTRCSHQFCCFCYGPILENHQCSKPWIPNTIIGSKKSKKNLRRL